MCSNNCVNCELICSVLQSGVCVCVKCSQLDQSNKLMFSLQHFRKFKSIDQYFTKTIKNRSRRILRLWTDHCEYIIAQRVRRSQQMICLYRRIWDEQALRWIVQQLRKQVHKSSTIFNWNNHNCHKNYETLAELNKIKTSVCFT